MESEKMIPAEGFGVEGELLFFQVVRSCQGSRERDSGRRERTEDHGLKPKDPVNIILY